MIQSQESIMKDEQEKKRLQRIIKDIADRASSGYYYSDKSNKRELEDVVKNIRQLIEKANVR